MSIVSLASWLGPIVQDDVLIREFRDALFPQILFRQEASPERWAAHQGETAVYTRKGLIEPATTPLTVGTDPTPKEPSYEQWSVTANQYGDAIDTHMPSNRTAIASTFASNAQQLGMSAGLALNRLPRNKLFQAYLSGDTVTQAGATSVSMTVASINGFTHTLVNGALVPVSVSAPLTVTIAGLGTRIVTAATPTSASVPLGPGTLTLSVSSTFAANARVLASNAPKVIRAGGATTIDGLTGLSKLTMADIRKAVAHLRTNRVPTHSDGLYHLHLDPVTESDLFADNALQRQIQSTPENSAFRDLAIGVAHGCLFIPNNECPGPLNSGTGVSSRSGDADALYSPDFHAEMRNADAVGIARSILTGGGAMIEKYVDESEYSSEAGYMGKVGSWSVTNNGMQVSTDRIRMILRAPQDRLQQMCSLAWSFTGDWGLPTDFHGGTSQARFKRAVVLESGSED